MVEDADAAFEWLRKNIRAESTIVLWGHEIGSVICLRVGTYVIYPLCV